MEKKRNLHGEKVVHGFTQFAGIAPKYIRFLGTVWPSPTAGIRSDQIRSDEIRLDWIGLYRITAYKIRSNLISHTRVSSPRDSVQTAPPIAPN